MPEDNGCQGRVKDVKRDSLGVVARGDECDVLSTVRNSGKLLSSEGMDRDVVRKGFEGNVELVCKMTVHEVTFCPRVQ